MKTLRIGNTDFEIGGRTYIMGILNVTPDSFSDGGRFNDFSGAVERALAMESEGADIIDIGGESTRPGGAPVSAAEELNRILPVVKTLCGRFSAPVSVDTYRAATAESVLKNGAALINDVWGFKKDPEIAAATARYKAACCLMHNRMNNDYGDIMEDILRDLEASINIALKAGVDASKIIVDPGIGFAKDGAQNVTVLRNLERLRELGFPVMLAASRKSVIGHIIGLGVNDRTEGTLALTVIGILKGCDFVRVHDVRENKRAALTADAIFRKTPQAD